MISKSKRILKYIRRQEKKVAESEDEVDEDVGEGITGLNFVVSVEPRGNLSLQSSFQHIHICVVVCAEPVQKTPALIRLRGPFALTALLSPCGRKPNSMYYYSDSV